jgi:hypothetical protein
MSTKPHRRAAPPTRLPRLTPADYVNEIVVPTVREFRDERRCRRRAYLACMVTFHIKDHLRRAGETGIEDRLRAATGDGFDVVRAICNGTKHPYIDRNNPIRFVAGDDWDRPPGAFGVLECGVSQLGDPVGGREIAAGPGRADLYQCVKRVVVAFKANFPAHLGGCDLSDC